MSAKKYWEIVFDQLEKEGWEIRHQRWSDRWSVDAIKDGKHHSVLADDINVAFLELQASVRCSSKDDLRST